MAEPDREQDPIEAALGRAFAKIDPPPTITVDAAAALFDFIDVDASLARLLEAGQPALRDPSIDQITYAWDDGLTMHLQTGRVENGWQVTGVLTGADPNELIVQFADHSTRVVPIVHGSFEVVVSVEHQYRFLLVDGDVRRTTPWSSMGDQS